MILRNANAPKKLDVADSSLMRKSSAAIGLAVAGLMFLSGCAHAPPEALRPVSVMEQLRNVPEDAAERTGDPGSGAVLTGTLAYCKGMQGCIVALTPGDVFMSLRLGGEYEGNYEVTVAEVNLAAVVFRKSVTFQLGTPAESYQSVDYGASATLFETDLRVRVERRENGVFAIVE